MPGNKVARRKLFRSDAVAAYWNMRIYHLKYDMIQVILPREVNIRFCWELAEKTGELFHNSFSWDYIFGDLEIKWHISITNIISYNKNEQMNIYVSFFEVCLLCCGNKIDLDLQVLDL